jgi:hypothetical protein
MKGKNLLSRKSRDRMKGRLFDHTQLGFGPYKLKDFKHPNCPLCEAARKENG